MLLSAVLLYTHYLVYDRLCQSLMSIVQVRARLTERELREELI